MGSTFAENDCSTSELAAKCEGAQSVRVARRGALADDGRMEAPLSCRLAFALFALSLAVVFAVILWWAADVGILVEWLPIVGGCAVISVAACVLLWREMARTRQAESLRSFVRVLEEQKAVAATYRDGISKDEGRIIELRREIVDELQRVLAMVRARNQRDALDGFDRVFELMGDGAYRQCDHRGVDAIATIKRRACEAAGVEPRFSLIVPCDVPISSVDLCAVVGNLADNGLAGALRFRESRVDCAGRVGLSGEEEEFSLAESRPFVELASFVEGGYLVIIARNPLSLADEASLAPERLRSSRRRATLDDAHGWGLSIVESMARRHDGWFSADACDGMFVAKVALRLGRTVG